MRIAYIAHGRFPTEKAYGHQIAQVSAALTAIGHDVTIVCPDVPGAIGGALKEVYRIDRDVPVAKLPAFVALQHPLIPGPLAVHASWFSYRRLLDEWLAAHQPDIVYARTVSVLAPALERGIPAILELHTIPHRLRPGFIRRCRRCHLIVALTTPMKDELVRRGVPAEKIMVEPDGVDLESFAHLPPHPKAKAHWSLPTDRPVIAYVGSLKTGHDLPKGVEELIDAAAILQMQGVRALVWIVGGPAGDVSRLQTLASAKGLGQDAIRFEGPVPSASVPLAMAAADLGVFPAPDSADPFFQRDTSPLKLLEYMAAGIPTVCADLPPIHDLADESVTRFCRPGDAADLARALRDALDDQRGSATRAGTAKERVIHFAWTARMARIMSSCSA